MQYSQVATSKVHPFVPYP